MISKFLLFAVVIATVFNGAHLQVSKIGKCPSKLDHIKGFKLDDFKGKWYEIQRYPLSIMMGRCLSLDIKLAGKGEKTEKGVKGPTITTTVMEPGKNGTVSQNVQTYGDNIRYKMTFGFVSANASFTVLDTDYKNYAAVYSCGDFFDFCSIQYAWILSRTRVLKTDLLGKALETFRKAGVDTTPLVPSDQTECKN